MDRSLSRLIPLVTLLALAGCDGSDTDRLERVQTVSMNQPLVLGGGGQTEYFGVIDAGGEADGLPGVRFYWHNYLEAEPIQKMETLSMTVSTASDAYLGGTGAVFAVGGSILLARWYPIAFEGWLSPSMIGVERAVRRGSVVLTSDGASIQLVFLTSDGPVKVGEYTAMQPVTGLLADPQYFLAFTAGGYIFVEPNENTALPPAFTEVADPVLRRFRRCYPSDSAHQAVCAGPSIYEGRSRVARLDLSNPEAPSILKVVELDGEYGAFAWDGFETSVVETRGEPGAGLYQGYRLHEDESGFAAAPISLPQWFGSEAHLAAHQGMLFALEPGGAGVYVIH